MTEQYKSTYKSARGVAKTISSIGWLIFIGWLFGWPLLLMFLGEQLGISQQFGSQKDMLTFLIFVGILPWIGGTLAGILVIAYGQLLRSTVDTADYTGELLWLMKKQAEDSD